MSYPSAPGTGTNLGCDTSLQRSQDTFNFQLNTGGGASSENNLQSPAAILADSAGATTLSFNASGTGSAVIQMNAAGGLPTKNAVRFSDPTANGIALYQDANVAGGLQIGNDDALVNIAVFNNATNQVILGRTSTLGSINLNAATVISDSVGGLNALGLSPTSATQSLICQTVATNGVLQIGSAISNPNILEVADIAGGGGVFIRSTAAEIPLVLTSTTAAGSSVICGAPSAGTLKLGSSAANPTAITLTDTATDITKLGGAPQNLAVTGLSLGNIPAGTVATPSLFSFPAPIGEGLYAIVAGSSGISTANSRQAQCTSICYVGPTGVVGLGGAAFADIGSIGSDDNIQFSAANNTTFNGAYVGTQQVNNFVVLAFKISGAIPGTF